jgi:NAD(P)-dependent dehydrogenase (short-subunit alcohol dehydrogenase family)
MTPCYPGVVAAQAVVPIMAAQGSGKIVNIGSLTGFTPVPLRWPQHAAHGISYLLLKLELGMIALPQCCALPHAVWL